MKKQVILSATVVGLLNHFIFAPLPVNAASAMSVKNIREIEIDSNHANITVKQTSSKNLKIKSGNVWLKKVGNQIEIDQKTKSKKIEILIPKKYKGRLSVSSEKGDIKIVNINSKLVDIENETGKITATNSSLGGEINNENGNINLSLNSVKDFLSIENERAKVELNVKTGYQYQIESENGTVTLPTDAKSSTNSSTRKNGTIGTDPQGTVFIESEFGQITLD
ncbi:MAG: DUF4097 domain-containing protein [Lactobacillaceae bacterium]|jgi:hypothetical protein|nr:DUF4097 domain-containing protein [Lactobacillaceae bacterium]